MGERQRHMRNIHLLCNLRSPAVKSNGGTAPCLANDFDFEPVHSSADAGSKGFCGSFFRGESGGKTLGRIPLPHAVGLLGGRIHAVEEALPEALNRLLDPLDLNQVDPATDDHHSKLTSDPGSFATRGTLNSTGFEHKRCTSAGCR